MAAALAAPVIGRAGRRLMQSGPHKGKRYADVPRGYLVWMIRDKAKGWRHAVKEMQRRRVAARDDEANAWRKVWAEDNPEARTMDDGFQG